ncbi:cellulase [Streptomyces sp. NPDC021080]|uniref:cellulase n=1 Tax=Streptomyces sp. NPDC021080 TaxID=3365110 RepID=UPI0037B0DB4B
MDHFERELARMMRDSQEHTPFEPAQQNNLRDGVRVRRRIRAAQRAASCVLAAAGISVGLFLLPHTPDHDRPLGPVPRPTVTPTSPYATLSPTPSSSGTPTESATATSTAENTAGTSGPPETPTTTGSSTSSASAPEGRGTATTSTPATEPATPSGTPTSSPPPSGPEPSSSAETSTG